MQRQLTQKRVSEEEEIKSAGLWLDFDEIAKKGAMTREESTIAKWYGIYGSRQTGNAMARLVIPGGVFSAAQARQIAESARCHAQGTISITTRQALQFHWLKVKSLPAMLRELGSAGISTFHGCGDVTRTVACCAAAEICPHRRFNVRPYALETARVLTSQRDLDNLPRKYKITFSGCDAGCAQPYMNCVGILGVRATIHNTEMDGFRVVIGGGMGWKAFVAQPLFSFVPPEQIVAVCRAVAILFRDHGDRFNRAKSRLKFVVDRMGIPACRQEVLKALENDGVPTDNLQSDPLVYLGGPVPERPLTDTQLATWPKDDLVRVRIPKGELDFRQLRRLAELSEMFADQHLYSTNRQNLEFHGVDLRRRDEFIEQIHALGFATDGVNGMRDIVACVGTTYCPKAVSATRELFDLLAPLLGQAQYSSLENRILINITGCPNSCSPYRIADIGFRGMRIRGQEGSAEGYEMLIGGDQQSHGIKLGEFITADCPKVVATVLDTFLQVGNPEETLRACVVRLGLDQFYKAVFT